MGTVRQLLRGFGLAIICGALSYLMVGTRAFADFPQVPFIISASTAPEVCRQIAVPTGQAAAILYGFHVTNTSASTVYAQVFNLKASPTASATPLAASSWAVGAASDRDVSIGEMQGWGSFNNGIEICCSTVQATYTAASTVCGIAVEYH